MNAEKIFKLAADEKDRYDKFCRLSGRDPERFGYKTGYIDALIDAMSVLKNENPPERKPEFRSGIGEKILAEKESLKVGQAFSFPLRNGKTVLVKVADIRGGKAYFTFWGINWFRPMNYDSMKKADWETSDMQEFLNTDVLSQLPDDLVELILPRKIGNWEGKLWLFSYDEVLGDEQFEIFKERGNRIMLDDKGTPRYWWLRSAYGASLFGYVASSGANSNYSAYGSRGVCPGFCISIED